MGFYSAASQIEIMEFTGKWVEWGNISEVTQARRDKHCLFALTRGAWLLIAVSAFMWG